MSWEETTIGEFVDIKHGFAFKSKNFSDAGTHIVLTPGNCFNDGGFKSKGDKEKWHLGDFPSEYLLNADDLLVVMTDLVQTAPVLGGSFLIPEDNRYLHNQRLGLVRVLPEAEIDKRFLYHLFNTYEYRGQVRGSASGATVRHTSPSRIKKCKVRVPDLSTQKRIAGVLSAYDDLIENNRRRIALLEEAARMIYREWFVHFRFPNHKNTKFENGLPVGWADGQIDDLFKTSSGGTPSRKKDGFYGGAVNWLKTQELKNGYIFGTDEKITEEGLRGSSAKLFPENTVVIAMYGATIGQLGLLAESSTTNQACCALLPLRDEKDYLFGYCLMDDKSQTLKDLGQGAAQNNVSQQVIKGLKIIVPRAEVISDFNKLIEPNFLQRKTLQQQNQSLTKARDLLLPRLMDGRIAV